MAVDIRATVTCSLGTLISGSVSDDYLQGSGLVKTRGSVEISGVITPAVGTAVTFSYVKDGVTRSIPRKLRVLSSFADPYRRTTKVELGCKLTYLSDLQEKIDWTAFDDPSNAGLTEDDAAIVTLPIRASSVANKCLSELGITASSMPLTNKFSVASFDFSAGYVQVLSDLLVSESYFGYLNTSEVLQVVSLSTDPGTGPVFAATDIVDLGPIGSGQMPGEAVTVSYSTLKLKNPEQSVSSGALLPGWEKEENSTAFAVPIAYDNNGTPATQTFNVLSTVEVITTYATITTTAGETIRVVSKRETTETTGSVAIAGGLVTEYLSNGIAFNNQTVYKYTTEKFAYDLAGNESSYERVVTGSAGHLAGSAGVPWVFGPSDYVTVFFANILPLEAEQRYTTTVGDRQKVQIYIYGPWGRTIEGQQSIAAARDSFTDATSVANYLALMFDPGLNPNKSDYGLSLLDYRTSINRRTEAQVAPSQADMLNADKAADGGDPNNGWRTESSSELELALGSATAQRRIELSMPYAPDDAFSGASGGPFTASPSDAAEKASRYGRVQNRLLLGNRNGMNLQLAPEKLPAAPFAPMYVQANGLTALYRANGNQWTMGSDGIVCSTDALFWSAIGGTGTFWFPVAPGVTTLPTTPPVVSGQITATTEVLPYNETVAAAGVLRTQIEVQSLPYALQLLTEVAAVSKTKLDVRRIRKIEVAAIDVTTTATTPSVTSGASVQSPMIDHTISAHPPTVSGGGSVSAPATDLSITVFEPAHVGRLATLVMLQNGSTPILALSQAIPVITSGASVSPAAIDISVAAPVPVVEVPRPVPTWVGYNWSASPSSFSLSWPAGHQTDDIGLIVIEASGADTTLPVPSGWVGLPDTPVVDVASTFGSKLQIWWKRATSNAEASVTIPDGGDHQIAALAVFRGCAVSGNPWDTTGFGSTGNNQTYTLTLPSVTTSKKNVLVAMIAVRPDDDSSATHFGTPVNATLSNIVDRFEHGSLSANGGGFMLATGEKTTEGATGTTTISKTVLTTGAYYVVALRSY